MKIAKVITHHERWKPRGVVYVLAIPDNLSETKLKDIFEKKTGLRVESCSIDHTKSEPFVVIRETKL